MFQAVVLVFNIGSGNFLRGRVSIVSVETAHFEELALTHITRAIVREMSRAIRGIVVQLCNCLGAFFEDLCTHLERFRALVALVVS